MLSRARRAAGRERKIQVKGDGEGAVEALSARRLA